MSATNGNTLKLEPGVPQVIALTYANGLAVKSRFSGDQLMWSLTDGRKLYTEPYVGERVRAAGIQPGILFEIEKVENHSGNSRTVSIQVRSLRASAAVPAPAPTPVTLDKPASSNTSPIQGTPPPPPLPPPAAPPMPVNGAGESHADIMARCYCAAVDIALATIACAEKKGLRLTAQFEDVRAMGTALLISETGRR